MFHNTSSDYVSAVSAILSSSGSLLPCQQSALPVGRRAADPTAVACRAPDRTLSLPPAEAPDRKS